MATRIGTFEGRSRFSTWLHEVTANQARQTYRSLRRRAAASTTDVPVDRPDPRTTSVIAGSRLDLLDVPVGTVPARIHHARRYVRESLDGSR